MTAPSPLLSACLIVRDEEEHLPRCLASLEGLADEVVVVDTGSTDDTVAIAEAAGARVFHEPWRNDFALHRNQAMDQARGRWLLIIDADEEVVDTDTAETRHHLENSPLPPLLMVRNTLIYPDAHRFDLVVPRVIRADAELRFQYPIHEQLDVQDCPAALSNIQLLHHGYVSAEGLQAKEQRNLAIAEAMDDNPHALHCRARSLMSTGDWSGVMDASRRLLDCHVGAAQRLDACALGGSAAFSLRDDDGLAMFLEAGKDLDPDCPDLRFLEMLDAARRYGRSLGDGADQGGSFLRPRVFRHNANGVERLIRALTGTDTENG